LYRAFYQPTSITASEVSRFFHVDMIVLTRPERHAEICFLLEHSPVFESNTKNPRWMKGLRKSEKSIGNLKVQMRKRGYGLCGYRFMVNNLSQPLHAFDWR